MAPAEQNVELYLMDGHIAVHLGFISQSDMEKDVLVEAVSLAMSAEYAVVFVGNNTQWETEGQDMEDMNLPADGSQDRLISAVAHVNPNTIVVNTTDVAITTPWLTEISAFIQAWYGGQETGNAILDVLLGVVNPSGKLPISWSRKYEDTAVYGNFGLDAYDSRQVEYVEGVYVGYRHFDRFYGTEKEALFPFGFGLSYSTFEVSMGTLEGRITPGDDDGVTVTAQLENTSSVAGAEVVQAYLIPPISASAERPMKSMVGFAKVFLDSMECKKFQISFRRDGAAFWDEARGEWAVDSGNYVVCLSTSSSPDDLKMKLALEVHKAFSFGP